VRPVPVALESAEVAVGSSETDRDIHQLGMGGGMLLPDGDRPPVRRLRLCHPSGVRVENAQIGVAVRQDDSIIGDVGMSGGQFLRGFDRPPV